MSDTELFPETLELDITADDIANGIRLNGQRCMVSRALRRIYPAADSIFTDHTVFTIELEHRFAAYTIPPSSTEIIAAWDKGTDPDPWRLTAELRFTDAAFR